MLTQVNFSLISGTKDLGFHPQLQKKKPFCDLSWPWCPQSTRGNTWLPPPTFLSSNSAKWCGCPDESWGQDLWNSSECHHFSPSQTWGCLDASASGLEATKGKAGAALGLEKVLGKTTASTWNKGEGRKQGPSCTTWSKTSRNLRAASEGNWQGRRTGQWRSWVVHCQLALKQIQKRKSVLPQPEVNYKMHPSSTRWSSWSDKKCWHVIPLDITQFEF